MIIYTYIWLFSGLSLFDCAALLLQCLQRVLALLAALHLGSHGVPKFKAVERKAVESKAKQSKAKQSKSSKARD